MGYTKDQDRFCSTPKLPLFSYPMNMPYETPGLATPPVNIGGSVPFLWEEAPGKPKARSSVRKPPRSKHTGEKRGVVRSLDLPPRLLLPGESCKSFAANEPSPTTVLDGPYDLRRRSLSLPRSAYVVRKLRGVPAPAPAKEKRLFGSSRWGSFGKCKDVSEGIFDFPRFRHGGCDCRRDWTGAGSDFSGDGGTKVKLFRLKRKGNLFNLSHATKSEFWGTVIQGFIPSARIDTYLPHMKAGGIYRLNNFFGSKNKTLYRVAEPSVTLTFSSTSALSVLDNSPVCFPDDRFRFYGYEEFDAACDLKGDLYDYVGHIKLVNGEVPHESLVLDESEIASTRRVLLHVQTHDGPVMKLYLWDKAALDFCEKLKATGGTAKVILVTTLNPKRFGGALTLSSMTSSRVFMDSDVQATREYLNWLISNSDVANRVDADVVTKTETVTIGELFSYMKQAAAKVAWFECTATVADVVHGSSWYYIGCGVCHTKATKGPTTLMCKKCGKSTIVGVPQFLAKISVYDESDQAFFVLLGDAGQELTGKKAAELVESYFEANESVGDDHMVPVPQALSDTIGQTRKFIVKVSSHNLDGKTQTLTVTKVLQSEAPEVEGELEEDVIVTAAQKTLDDGGAEDDPSMDSNVEKVKRAAENDEAENPKRAKCG